MIVVIIIVSTIVIMLVVIINSSKSAYGIFPKHGDPNIDPKYCYPEYSDPQNGTPFFLKTSKYVIPTSSSSSPNKTQVQGYVEIAIMRTVKGTLVGRD